MYANQYGYANPPPTLTNNPFVGDPTDAHARFPDLNAPAFQQYQPQYHSYSPAPPYQAQPQAMPPQSQFTSTSYVPQYPAQGYVRRTQSIV
jgi:hypothetical protein